MKVVCAALGLLSVALLARPLSAAENTLFPALKENLVTLQGKELKQFDDAPLENAKYYAFYFSAAWCGPCRSFTPELVKSYKKLKRSNPQFELVFVSSDRSAEDMASYMKEYDMEWPALAFDKKGSSQIRQYGGKGIPRLVLVDASGKVVSDSYVGEEYVGPRKVLEDIEKTLKKDPAAGGAAKAGAGSSSFDEFFKKKPAGE